MFLMESGKQDTKEHESKLHIWYNKSYKWLLVLPLILLLFSAVYLFNFYQKNGDIIYKDVSITGGTTITVFGQEAEQDVLHALVSQFPDVEVHAISDLQTGKQLGFVVATTESADNVKAALEKYLEYSLTADNSSIEYTGASLSSSFYKQLKFAIVLSFVLMAVVVFIIFRTPVRSLSIILAGMADIIMTIVVVDMMGMRLSAAGIVALLMLIGYSVDADILLTTRVVKYREGNFNHRMFGAFKTGMTMTLTAIAAIAVAFIFTRTLSPTLAQMFTIILIGLVFDIFNCWVTNASILKWYGEAKGL